MLTRDQQREILAVGVLALALFVLLALLPTELFGARGDVWFPSGNMMGLLGGTLKGLLVAFLGASAFLLPALLVVAGLRTGRWGSSGGAVRAVALGFGLLLLLPITIRVVFASSAGAGWLGTSLADPLMAWVGWLGALLVCGAGLIALSVATLGWNPVRSVGRGVVAGGEAASRTARVLAERRRAVALAGPDLEEIEEESSAESAELATSMQGLEPDWVATADRAGRRAEKRRGLSFWGRRKAKKAAGGAGAGDENDETLDERDEVAAAEAAGAGSANGKGRRRGRKGRAAADDNDRASAGEAGAAMSADAEGEVAAASGAQASGASAQEVGADTVDGVVPAPVPPLPDEFREEVDDLAEADEGDFADPNADSGFGNTMPPVDLLSAPDHLDRASMERQLDELGQVLVEKLRTFNVQSEIGGRTTGPMVTQFEVVPAPGVKVNRIANLDADLALAMKAQTIRIVAPIPGKGAVGVEIPNPEPEIVNLREILETSAFRNAKGDLPLALGKDLTGRPYVTPLEKMPHVLIAGATGAGKSVCINTLITSLVFKHTPETLRLLMIDPKMVELSVYSRLPHLRHNVVTDPRDAAGVLKWAVLEMERRYALLKTNQVRSITEFNRKVRGDVLLKRNEPKGPEGDEDRWIYKDGVLPYIVVVVDELADLMMTVQSEIEKPLTQLAQKARAIGIHLIVATQRPSVNVITGLIKANFPTRIAFRVASKIDSRTILDQNGADALLGNGDMLFLPPGRSDPVRIQGAFLSTEDTERLMAWYIELLEQRGIEPPEDESIAETDILDELRHEIEEAASEVEEIAGDWDELFRSAAEVCIQNAGASTSLLQRRLSIGYGRAARIIDQLFDAGVIGPSDGSKGREVLIGFDELDAICGPG